MQENTFKIGPPPANTTASRYCSTELRHVVSNGCNLPFPHTLDAARALCTLAFHASREAFYHLSTAILLHDRIVVPIKQHTKRAQDPQKRVAVSFFGGAGHLKRKGGKGGKHHSCEPRPCDLRVWRFCTNDNSKIPINHKKPGLGFWMNIKLQTTYGVRNVETWVIHFSPHFCAWERNGGSVPCGQRLMRRV